MFFLCLASRVAPTHKRQFAFEVHAAAPDTPLAYTVKDSRGVSMPGSEKALLLAAATDAQRQTWIDDISGNAVHKPKLIPIVALENVVNRKIKTKKKKEVK